MSWFDCFKNHDLNFMFVIMPTGFVSHNAFFFSSPEQNKSYLISCTSPDKKFL